MTGATDRSSQGAAGGLDSITGVSLVPVVLTDGVFLPGETHRLDASWDEEMAVLAGLSGPDDRIVLLPRAVHYFASGPATGVLAFAAFRSPRRESCRTWALPCRQPATESPRFTAPPES